MAQKVKKEEVKKKVVAFNRIVITVPAPHRLLADRLIEEESFRNQTDFYRDVIRIGLGVKYPKEFARLQDDWKEHVKGVVDSGEDSDYYLNDQRKEIFEA